MGYLLFFSSGDEPYEEYAEDDDYENDSMRDNSMSNGMENRSRELSVAENPVHSTPPILKGKDEIQKPNQAQRLCPDCDGELRFIPPVNKWYCHACKDFFDEDV